MTPRDHFKKYKSCAQIVAFLELKGYADKECDWLELDSLHEWYMRHERYQAVQKSKETANAIRAARAEDSSRRYIVFSGGYGYLFMVSCRNLKNCPDRTGKTNKNVFGMQKIPFKVEDVIADSLLEYSQYTGDTMEGLKITAMSEKELLGSGLFSNLDNPCKYSVIGVPDKFWDDCFKKRTVDGGQISDKF
jgi:hypothetical protein